MAKKSSKRTLWILLTLLVVFVATGLIGRAAGWFEAETGTAVDIAEAQRRTLTQLVSASGIIRPEVEVILSPDVSGEIIELPVKEGDFVNQGDLLLRIRPDLYEARIDEIQAGLLNARAREQQALASKLRAEVNYESQRQLYERELIPRMEYITAKTQFEAEEANHNAARYTVQSVRSAIKACPGRTSPDGHPRTHDRHNQSIECGTRRTRCGKRSDERHGNSCASPEWSRWRWKCA